VEQAIWDRITAGPSVAIVSHRDPDGDTLGSMLGLYHALKHAGTRCYAVNASEIPLRYRFLPGVDRIRKALPNEVEIVVTVDGAGPALFDVPLPPPEQVVVIDHHLEETPFGHLRLILPEMASCAEVVYRLLTRVGALINRPAATALYTGLVSDTQFFKTDRVRADTLQAAAGLIQRGADPVAIARELSWQMPLSLLRLKGRALTDMQLVLDGRLAYFIATKEVLETTGADLAEAKELPGELLSATTAQVALVVYERITGGVKCSLRSKSGVDVASIARGFGGGGHRYAAGFAGAALESEAVVNQIQSILQKEFSRGTTDIPKEKQ